jgi:hypothetical protein
MLELRPSMLNPPKTTTMITYDATAKENEHHTIHQIQQIAHNKIQTLAFLSTECAVPGKRNGSSSPR